MLTEKNKTANKKFGSLLDYKFFIQVHLSQSKCHMGLEYSNIWDKTLHPTPSLKCPTVH